MAPFVTTPVHWAGERHVHTVWNSVRERTSKFTRCGQRIQAGATYEGTRPAGASITEWRALVVTCPECLAFNKRDEERSREG